ncbi:hypothetical protein [Actinomycetospora sp. NBC_00405]|uniref:hypothetical protein n=1 Tax=Actinomycetospora sp. NBC_00405 TaxID=2975952 RepID=UPI002E220BC5
MSGETPIYDATCRAVGPPPAAGGTSAEVSHAPTEAGDARPGTVARSSPAAQSGDRSLPSPDDDPRTADLSIPEGDLSGTHAESP